MRHPRPETVRSVLGFARMYCPLCKAEYRAGFDRCSDCLVSLVRTREEAARANVVLLWEGTRQSRFNDIVGALRDANVPNYSRSAAKAEREPSVWAKIPFIGLFARAKEAYEQASWQVFILESDYPRARAIIEDRV